MADNGRIIGLTGPSGVGKGHIKEYVRNLMPDAYELTVATTRGRRASDGADRDTDIPVGIFLQRADAGEIIFAHQPFGDIGDWYGFYDEQIKHALTEGRLILTEIHVENVPLFKKNFGERVFVLGLIAPPSYLEANLTGRDAEIPEDTRRRLEVALQEVNSIQRLHAEGLVDVLLHVDEPVRGEVAGMAWKHVERALGARKEIA